VIPARALAGLAAAALHWAAPAARGAELDLAVELGAGVDTNPERATGPAGPAKGFATALLRLEGRAEGERGRAEAALTAAARGYPGASGSSALASRLDAAGALALGGGWSAGGALVASDLTERAGRLDQDVLRGEASLGLAGAVASGAVAAGYGTFAPRDPELRPFEARGPAAALRLGVALPAGHGLGAAYTLWAATYPRWRAFAGQDRDDRTHTVSLEWSYRGAFLAAAGGSYAWNLSSAPGGAFRRARLTARAAAELPLAVTLAVRGALQWSTYPDPALVGQQVLLAAGSEDLDALEVRLARPLAGGVEAFAALALHRGETVTAPGLAPSYGRTVGTVGVAWRTPLTAEP
jgi:hypothetical protein